MKTQIEIPEQFTAKQIERVALFGSADVTQDDPVSQAAYEAAQVLAKQGKIIVNGGGPGVMQAATKGAVSVNGKTVAVTFYPKDMPEFEGRDQENIVSLEFQTANYIERMFGLIYYADLFICFKGGTGTLSEWATAWLFAHLYYGKHKPLILYGDFWHQVMDVIYDNFFIGEKEKDVFKIVKDQQEMLEAVKQFEQEIANRP